MSRALEGVRVLDFSQLIAGPSATSMLAEMGADVVKIEPPAGDASRNMGRARQNGLSGIFIAYNKGKRSITLDLSVSEGRETVLRMVQQADILLEAFRPGVMERMGLGYEAVQAVNPGIVYGSFSGFGQTGPMRDRAGVDLLIQGESGIMSITGEADGPPMKIGFTAVDAAAGFAIGQALLAGLVRKMRSGEGSYIAMSLLDVALFMQAAPFTEFLIDGREPGRHGNRAPLGSPAELFETADHPIIISGYFPHQWQTLCDLLGVGEIAMEPRFATNQNRIVNRSELHAILQERFLTRSSVDWKALFEPTKIFFGDVLDYGQVLERAQIRHNDMVVDVGCGSAGMRSIRGPARFEGIAYPQEQPVPQLGEDRLAVLVDYGFDEAEIRNLEAAKAFG